MTRQAKTPTQRAEEQLAVANRAVVRLDHKADALRADLVVVEAEQRAAIARRDYLAQHPDLPQSTAPSTTNQAGATTP